MTVDREGQPLTVGWTMARQRDGTFEFTGPTGRRLRSKPVRHKPPPTVAA